MAEGHDPGSAAGADFQCPQGLASVLQMASLAAEDLIAWSTYSVRVGGLIPNLASY